MAGDRVADRVARANKWHELIERAGSQEAAWRMVRQSRGWAQTYDLYPHSLGDQARLGLTLDLMVAADRETRDDGPQQPGVKEQALDARAERWRVPFSSYWFILEQRVKRGKLAKVAALSEQTRRSPKLPFVGRTRMANLVAWIDEHPEQARRSLDLHEIPAGFRANEAGVLIPRSQ